MAELQILYRERSVGSWSDAIDAYEDRVMVELRKWTAEGRTDYVLEYECIVDDERAAKGVNIIGGPTGIWSDARVIRHAIAEFDSLLNSHPNKLEMQ